MLNYDDKSDPPSKVVVFDDGKTVRVQSNRRLSATLPRPLDDKKAFYDVTLYGGDDLVGIRAHKWVLCNASEHLRDLFTSDGYIDSNMSQQPLENIHHDTLDDIIEFIYTGILRMDSISEHFFDRMQNLLIAAKYLVISDIADACEKFFTTKSQLHLENFVRMWRFARRYSCYNLMEVSSIGIANNLSVINTQSDYLNLTMDDITKLLLSEPVIVADADQRCFAAIAWLEHDAEHRAKHASDVINMVPVDFGLISRDTIAALSDVSEHIQQHVPKLFQRMVSNTVKRFKPDDVSSSFFAGEKQLSGFMQRNAWSVIGGYGAKTQFVQYDTVRNRWEKRSPLPWCRIDAGVCMLRDRIAVIGGIKAGFDDDTTDEFKFATSLWGCGSEQQGSRLSYRRSCLFACSDNNNTAYVFGGNDETTCSLAEAYDIDAGDNSRVVRLANMSAGRCRATGVFDDANNAVFLAGGRNVFVESLREGTCALEFIHHYDILNDKWTLVGNMSMTRGGLASVLMGDDLYLMGGEANELGDVLDEVEIFNVRTGGKTRSAPDMLHCRDGCRAAAMDENVLCVLGGRDESWRYLCSVEVFDKREGYWTTGVVVADMPNKCSYFGLAACPP